MSRHAVIVLNRLELLPDKYQRLQQGLAEWFALLRQQKGFVGIEEICSTDKNMVWIEQWVGKADLDAFNSAHLAYADFLALTVECSRGMPKRDSYQWI